MPLLHCSKCHHEWESASELNGACDWCGALGYVLAKTTPLERLMDHIKKVGLEKFFNLGVKNDSNDKKE